MKEFGSQCIVASLEVYRRPDGACEIWTDYGRQQTGIDAFGWAQRVVELGVGEIMLTSINREGTGRGYDLELIHGVAEKVPVPVIAVGGAGNKKHMLDAIRLGKADAVAAASIFHYKHAKPVSQLNMSFNERRLRMGDHIDSGNIQFLNFGYGGYQSIPVTPTSLSEVKAFIAENGIPMRIVQENQNVSS